jgi:hypothetical protein
VSRPPSARSGDSSEVEEDQPRSFQLPGENVLLMLKNHSETKSSSSQSRTWHLASTRSLSSQIPRHRSTKSAPSWMMEGDDDNSAFRIVSPSAREKSSDLVLEPVPSKANQKSDRFSSRAASGFSRLPEGISNLLSSWHSLAHVSVIHRQGLNAPPAIFQLKVNEGRSYYELLLPQSDELQKETYLCCRQKTGRAKVFRFSYDPLQINKKNNPSYIGSMVCPADNPNIYNILLESGQQPVLVKVVFFIFLFDSSDSYAFCYCQLG